MWSDEDNQGFGGEMASVDEGGLRRVHLSALPVSGAWRPDHHPGRRRFVALPGDRPFVTEGGAMIHGGVEVAYETWGTLAPDGSNAVLVCHALTGDSHASGPLVEGHATAGWWDALVGPGRAIDTDRSFVVCANVLGGCQGTTGPAHPHPDDGRPWGSRFPVVSIRDMVRCQVAVADRVGVKRWATVIGGSMGGMQALEWAAMYPERVRSIIPIATCFAATAQQIGWWSTGRRIIRLDPKWHGGDYYDAAPGDGPSEGLALARQVSQITFRTDDVFTDRFGRDEVEPISGGFELWQRFEVERYLEYHGDKLVRRFDANSYLLLTKAMDLHDVGRGRGGAAGALARYDGQVLALGVSSDLLYPSYQSREIVEVARGVGLDAEYIEIESVHGHDAFLLEVDQVADAVEKFLAQIGGVQ
jgi:homoserine O-acetyltransferase/O-succinyltransferase